ncbi:hypothetical protein GGI13_001330 [Coemansia sp. RSA 455]|nr:hypothetical protein GGI13_001330 [Coemansia sp. RSA 455]
MPLTLQTLPKQIVDKIIDHCYDRQLPAFHPKFFRVYNELQSYSHLCRRLREASLPYLESRLIFERYNLAVEGVDKQTLSHEELKAAKRLPAVIRWMTNMRRVVETPARVKELIISTFDRYPNPDDVLDMLRQQKFEQLKWSGVTTLCISFKSDYDIDDGEKDEGEWISDEAFAALSSFLAEHLPMVDTLWMDDNRCRRVGPRNVLSNYVAERLDRLSKLFLRFAYMPAFGVKTLPPHITHLTLTVHSAYDFIDIPRVMAPMLKSLTLSAIPLSHLWDKFSGSGVVDFAELRRLDLTFHVPYRSIPSGKTEDDLMWERYHKENTDGPDGKPLSYVDPKTDNYKGNTKLKTISVKERTPKYTVLKSDKRPRFPKLQHLQLNLYPGRIRDFLRDIPLQQLLTLRISADLVAFKGLRLTGLDRLQSSNICYYSESKLRESPHANRFLAKAFAQPPTLRRLTINTSSKCRLRPPPTLSCTGIRRLKLTAQISYADLPAMLRQLPRLEFLDLQRALFVDPPPLTHTAEGMAQHFLALSDTAPVSTSLVKFVPDVLCRNATDEVVFYNIFMLIARVPSLRELKMFSFYSTQFFRELLPLFKIPDLSKRIRHLASLECNE